MAKEQRQYEKQFKIDAVEHYLNHRDKPARVIAQNLGIPEKTFYAWIKDYKKEGSQGFKGKGVIKSSNEELLALKREIANLKEERDILKKAVAIFSKPKI
jgi:transposase